MNKQDASLTVRFYEGSYQYKASTIVKPATEANLFTGILYELNHQYNYRPTGQDLWVAVMSTDSEILRVSRVSSTVVKVWNLLTGERYSFSPLEKYQLTFVIEL